MLNKKICLAAIAIAIAFTFTASGEANAQWGHGCGYGYQGQIGNVQPITRSQWGHGYRSYLPNYGYRAPVFHDTTHLDWHGPTIRRHGNHFHVQRGHYDVHRTGHWHH